ncbi:MAG: hypothetical protein ACETWC_09225, partial [Acidobacteriota bacterium]
QKGALLATTFGRRYSLGSYTALLLVFLFLAIGLARLTGYWQTTSSTGRAGPSPEAQRERYQPAVPSEEEERRREGGVELREGVVIRGSMTLEQVAEKAELTHEELCRRLRIPTSTSKKSQLKDIMQKYGYRMSQIVRMLRAEEGEVPRQQRNSQEQRPPGSEAGPRQRRGGGVVIKSGVTLRGSMSLQQVAEAMGLTHQELCQKLRIPSTTPGSLTLREIMSSYGYTMSQIARMLEEP